MPDLLAHLFGEIRWNTLLAGLHALAGFGTAHILVLIRKEFS